MVKSQPQRVWELKDNLYLRGADVEQERNNFKKCSILKRKKGNTVSKEKLEAHLLDYMQKHPELTPEPPSAPPEEFQMIMEELNRRGTKLLIRKQLEIINNCRRMVCYLHKPFIIAMTVCVLVSVTTIGVSSKRAYKFYKNETLYSRMNDGRSQGRQIGLNGSSIKDAYGQIHENFNTRALKGGNKPDEIPFHELNIQVKSASVGFTCIDQAIFFLQTAYNNFFHRDLFNEVEGILNEFTACRTKILIDGTYYDFSLSLPDLDFKAIAEEMPD